MAYAPFHESSFRQHLAHSSPQELSLMQQMLDWREAQIQSEISLLDAANDRSHGKHIVYPVQTGSCADTGVAEQAVCW